MSVALKSESHASMSEISGTQSHQSRQATATADDALRIAGNAEADGHRDPAICPTDDEHGSVAVATKQPLDKRSFDYLWRSGVAGGLAGCAAKTVVAPLDRVKILFQSRNPHFLKYTTSHFGTVAAIRDIYLQDGARGLFRGHSATLLRIFPYASIKFLAYEQIRAVIIPHHSNETPLRRLLSGSLAGVTSVFFTYPLEVIRVRLAFETKRDNRSGLRGICKQIYHETPKIPKPAPGALPTAALEAAAPKFGLINFYRGFAPTLLGMLPYAGMSFLTHDTAGDLLRHPSIAKHTTLPQPPNAPKGKPPPLKYWAELVAGGVAGLVSQTASYPLEVIRRRMQVGGAVGDGHRMRIGETARLIMKERGLRGFWIGLTIGYVKVVPLAATSFFVYERLKTYLGV